MKRQNQRLNVTVSKIPLRDQFQIMQMSCLFHGPCKEARLHYEHDPTGCAGPSEAIMRAGRQHVNRPRGVFRYAGPSADSPFGGDIALHQEVDEVGGMFVIRNRDWRHVAERFHRDPVPACLFAGKGRERRKWGNGATVAHYLNRFDWKNSSGVHPYSRPLGFFMITVCGRSVFWTNQSEELTKAGSFYHARRGIVHL